MKGAVFGSFSITEFYDLHDLNIRYNHGHSVFFEINHNSVVGIKHGKIDNFKKKDKNNYMIGIHAENLLDIKVDKHYINYFESNNQSDDILYLIDTKKEFFYLTFEKSKITFTTAKSDRLYISENHSFSTTPVNGFEEMYPNIIHSIPIFMNNKFITSKREYGIL